MSRSSLMLDTLKRAHGGWVSRAELFNDAGVFYLTNNASSELRAKGYEVEHRLVKKLPSYRLLGERDVDGMTSGNGVPLTEEPPSPHGREPSSPLEVAPGQLSLETAA